MTAWLPPLPLLGEGGWGGEGQVCGVRVFPIGVLTPCIGIQQYLHPFNFRPLIA